jgi:eukaryotic-like serine/threonine-protein kinase
VRQPIPFGKYLLLERISVGGMAEVFKAKSFGVEGFEKIIAIKRILPSMAEDADFIEMFIDEAKIAGQLSHAHICQIFELGKIADSHFIAMEYIWGKDLLQIENRFRKLRQKMPIAMACNIASRVCEGLDHAHRKRDALGRPLQIIHRDVSPQNVLISYEGEVKVIDFGIAKAASRSSRTQAGVLKGKFGYMSPEQVRGLPLDRRSDVFAIGTLLWECLTGERLFANDSDFSTLERVRTAEVEPPTKLNPKVPPELEAIVMKALHRNVEQRYQWANELQEALHQVQSRTEPAFTAKQLAAWMKEAFAADLQRERAQMEIYKRLGRGGEGPTAAPTDAPEDREVLVRGEATEVDDPGSARRRPSLGEEPPTDVYGEVGAGNGSEASRPGLPLAPAHASPGAGAPEDHGPPLIAAAPTTILPDRHLGISSSDGVVQGPMSLGPSAQSQAPTQPLLPMGVPALPLRSPPSLPYVHAAASPQLVPGRPAPRLSAPQMHVPIVTAPAPLGGHPLAPPPGAAGAPDGYRHTPRAMAPVGPAALAGGYPPSHVPFGSSPSAAVGPPALGAAANAGPVGVLAHARPLSHPRMRHASGPPESTLVRDLAIGLGAAVLVAGTIAGAYFLGTRVFVRHVAEGAPVAAPATTLVVATGDSGEGEVYVNSVRKTAIHGGEPVTIEGLTPGEYEVAVRRSGMPDCQQRVALDARAARVVTCRFQPMPLTGTVMLTVVTYGATVLVDDQEVSQDAAREPIILSADARHTITVKKPGFVSQSIPVALHPGEVAAHRVELEAAPKGATASPAAARRGDREPGAIAVAAAPSRTAAAPGIEGRLSVSPPAAPGVAAGEVGYITADTRPWARVLIDGNDTGKMTPIAPRGRIPLPPGKHTVTFVVAQETFSFGVTVEPGQELHLVKQLPVAEAGKRD